MLPIKKIYIDTRLKAPDSRSDSDFFIDLPTTFLMPEDYGFYMDDVCIPHSWYTVEEGRNDKLCFSLAPFAVEATVPPGIYTVPGLGAAIATAMSNAALLVTGSVFTLTHTYNKLQETFTISLAQPNSFFILTDAELKTDGKTAILARSINSLIKNYTSNANNNISFLSLVTLT